MSVDELVMLTRPRLRGVVHAAAAPLALVGTWALWRASAPSVPHRTSALVFGGFLAALFTTSAVYHVPRWTAPVRRALARCDVAMIVLFIAATYTPVAVHALDGAWRTWSLVAAWVIALAGAAVAASPLVAPRWLAVAGYIAFGWLGAVPLLKVAGALPWPGIALLALGGVLYTAGGTIYALRRPDPWPAWFGYHEVFHVLVVAGGATHFVAIWRYALPLA